MRAVVINNHFSVNVQHTTIIRFYTESINAVFGYQHHTCISKSVTVFLLGLFERRFRQDAFVNNLSLSKLCYLAELTQHMFVINSVLSTLCRTSRTKLSFCSFCIIGMAWNVTFLKCFSLDCFAFLQGNRSIVKHRLLGWLCTIQRIINTTSFCS